MIREIAFHISCVFVYFLQLNLVLRQLTSWAIVDLPMVLLIVKCRFLKRKRYKIDFWRDQAINLKMRYHMENRKTNWCGKFNAFVLDLIFGFDSFKLNKKQNIIYRMAKPLKWRILFCGGQLKHLYKVSQDQTKRIKSENKRMNELK